MNAWTLLAGILSKWLLDSTILNTIVQPCVDYVELAHVMGAAALCNDHDLCRSRRH